MEAEDTDADDVEVMEETKQLLNRVGKQLPFIFNADDREEFALHHGDVTKHNLIIDPKGKLQALVDWDFVAVSPLWISCELPDYLDRPERTEKSNPGDDATGTDDGDNQFYGHIREFEITYLRGRFLEEMTRLMPQSIQEHRKSNPKTDFELALPWCNGRHRANRMRA